MTSTSRPASGPSSPSTFTARRPEDVLAMIPIVLGFAPTESVVMLTVGAAHSFHARVDLPPPEHADEVLSVLLSPARRHRVGRVMLILYAEDGPSAELVGRVLAEGFRGAGIEVIDLLRTDGHRWYPLLRQVGPEEGVPYDVSNHPFAAQAVVDGRVTLGSRSALVDSLAPEADAVARVAAHLGQARPASPRWIRATVERWVASRQPPPDDVVARLLVSLADGHCRDAAWASLRRDNATAHVELWTGLLRRAPDEVVGDTAAVLALAAWVAGHGALAWCAIERSEELRPGHSLARLVADLVGAAVSPADWEEALHGRRPA